MDKKQLTKREVLRRAKLLGYGRPGTDDHRALQQDMFAWWSEDDSLRGSLLSGFADIEMQQVYDWLLANGV